MLHDMVGQTPVQARYLLPFTLGQISVALRRAPNPDWIGVSRRVDVCMNQAAGAYNLLAIHVNGKAVDHVEPCAQCAAKEEHPSNRGLSWCAGGNSFRTDYLRAYRDAWYMVARVRRDSGLPARAVTKGDITLQHFYDYEYQMPGKPRGLKRQPDNMFRVEEIRILGRPASVRRPQ
jgi:hypothetical protein